MEAGFGTLMARALAKIIVHRARRIAEESQRRGEVFDTLRFLARRDRQPRAVLRCARLLVEAWDKSSIVETVFDEAGYNESEFIGLLRATVARQPVSYDRIMQIAALLVPYLSLKRGPAMTAASIAHEHCLSLPQIAQHLKRRPPDTQQKQAEYVDALTQATRREFGLPNFDSRPARRRLNAKN
jgi:hypothetical protein